MPRLRSGTATRADYALSSRVRPVAGVPRIAFMELIQPSRVAHAIEPLSDIRVQLLGRADQGVIGELYAKVTGPLGPVSEGFIVRFAAIPADVASLFSRLIGADES